MLSVRGAADVPRVSLAKNRSATGAQSKRTSLCHLSIHGLIARCGCHITLYFVIENIACVFFLYLLLSNIEMKLRRSLRIIVSTPNV